ncbi:MAG: TetR family transcriptional regulator [Cohaesibacter sp.]|nr:TetR family transcriptional regulator [Cohaesibacter sp.]MCV6602793.1 TetR family transcriptional regulator [Cohaesibacter sp.]
MARKTKEEAEKTYHALLQAAANLFTRYGIAETTLNQIAKEAGVTRGAFYWHFEDKNDVVRALWETHAKPQLEPLRAEMLGPCKGCAVESLRTITKRLLSLVTQNEQMGQAIRIVMHNVELSEQNSALRQYLVAEHGQMIACFGSAFQKIKQVGLLRSDVSVETISWGYICLLAGMLDKHFIPDTPDMITTQGTAIMDLYLDGVIMVHPD